MSELNAHARQANPGLQFKSLELFHPHRQPSGSQEAACLSEVGPVMIWHLGPKRQVAREGVEKLERQSPYCRLWVCFGARTRLGALQSGTGLEELLRDLLQADVLVGSTIYAYLMLSTAEGEKFRIYWKLRYSGRLSKLP